MPTSTNLFSVTRIAQGVFEHACRFDGPDLAVSGVDDMHRVPRDPERRQARRGSGQERWRLGDGLQDGLMRLQGGLLQGRLTLPGGNP